MLLVWEGPQQGEQGVLTAQLPDYTDHDPVHGRVPTDLEETVGLQLGLEEGDERGALEDRVQVGQRVHRAHYLLRHVVLDTQIVVLLRVAEPE